MEVILNCRFKSKFFKRDSAYSAAHSVFCKPPFLMEGGGGRWRGEWKMERKRVFKVIFMFKRKMEKLP